MPKHQLTREEKIRGLRAALKSGKTPKHLKSALRRHLERLENGTGDSGRKRQRSAGFLGWFRF